MTKKRTLRLTYAAVCLSLAMVLPLITAQVPDIGNALCPMHLPILLCGCLCGWYYGFAVGAIAPLLRFAIFGKPPLLPTGMGMVFELAAYGLIIGICYAKFPKKLPFTYLSLLIAMVGGRVVWCFAQMGMAYLGVAKAIPPQLFFAESVALALPGIIAQIVLIPLVVFGLQKARLVPQA